MRFTIPLILAFVAVASAASIPSSLNATEPGDLIMTDGITSAVITLDILNARDLTIGDGLSVTLLDSAVDVEKRGATAETVGGKAGDAGVAIGKIFNALLQKLFPLKDWNPARETFTKATVQGMWNNNPNQGRWVAAICYNEGWDVSNRAGISDVQSVALKLGAFHTDYDCMYVGRQTSFWTRGDGGYINLAVIYNSGYCNFDSASDLNCN